MHYKFQLLSDTFYGSLLGQTCLMPWLPTYAAWDTLSTVLHCPAQSLSDDNTVSQVSAWILWTMHCTEVHRRTWTSSSSLNERDWNLCCVQVSAWEENYLQTPKKKMWKKETVLHLIKPSYKFNKQTVDTLEMLLRFFCDTPAWWGCWVAAVIETLHQIFLSISDGCLFEYGHSKKIFPSFIRWRWLPERSVNHLTSSQQKLPGSCWRFSCLVFVWGPEL